MIPKHPGRADLALLYTRKKRLFQFPDQCYLLKVTLKVMLLGNMHRSYLDYNEGPNVLRRITWGKVITPAFTGRRFRQRKAYIRLK